MTLAARAYQVAYHDTPVREFHEAFGLPVNYDPSSPPSIEQRVLRVQMLASELVELARASGVRLLVDTQDAGDHLADDVERNGADATAKTPAQIRAAKGAARRKAHAAKV